MKNKIGGKKGVLLVGKKEVLETNIASSESENEKNVLDYDKMYFLSYPKYVKVISKLSLFGIIAIIFGNVMFQGIPWWAKALFGVGVLFLGILIYYDLKYIRGLKKHPFMIYPERKVFRYYNEFEGNKEIDITKIREIKIYYKQKEPNVIEMHIDNQKDTENVYLAGFDIPTINEMLQDMLSINPEIVITSKEPKNKRENKKK